MKTLQTIAYWIAQCTWGILETIFGLIVALVLLITKHKPKKFLNTFYFICGKGWGGFSLGPVIVASSEGKSLLNHEYGHTMQNIMFGPLMLFIVSIPSAARYWVRRLYNNKSNNLVLIEVVLTVVVTIITVMLILTPMYWINVIIWLAVDLYLIYILVFMQVEQFIYGTKGLTEYDSVWFEGQATKIGDKLNA